MPNQTPPSAYTIDQIAAAIAYWSKQENCKNPFIGPNTSRLADILGLMFYDRLETIPSEQITSEQIHLLEEALSASHA